MSPLFRLSLLTASIAVAFPVLATDNSSQNDTDTVTVVGNWLDNPDTSSVLLNHPGARSIVTQQQMHEQGAPMANGIIVFASPNRVRRLCQTAIQRFISSTAMRC